MSNTTYTVYVLYVGEREPHYVGISTDAARPSDPQHHSRKDHIVTSLQIVGTGLTLEDATKMKDSVLQRIKQYS